MQVNRKVVRAGELVVGARAAITVGEKARQTAVSLAKRFVYQIAVADTDPLYPVLERELLPMVKRSSLRRMKARFDRDMSRAPVQWQHTGGRLHRVEAGGRWVLVQFGASEAEAMGTEVPGTTIKVDAFRPAGDQSAPQVDPPKWLVINCGTAAARDNVMGWIAELGGEERARLNPPRLHAPRWGGWPEMSRPLRRRDPSTLYLAPGLWDDLVADLDAFYAAEDRYRELGLPWRRGFLMSGPPGTGKTSTVLTLAGYYGKDVWIIPLADISADGEFLNLVSAVTGGFVVLEDIDVAGAAQDRDDHDSGRDKLTLAGLLNGLDGLTTPEGIVVFMMSNRPEVLDEALVREGRADRRVHVGHATRAQVIDAYRQVYRRDPPGNLPEEIEAIGMNTVMEVFKRHLDPDDWRAAWEALLARITPLTRDVVRVGFGVMNGPDGGVAEFPPGGI